MQELTLITHSILACTSHAAVCAIVVHVCFDHLHGLCLAGYMTMDVVGTSAFGCATSHSALDAMQPTTNAYLTRASSRSERYCACQSAASAGCCNVKCISGSCKAGHAGRQGLLCQQLCAGQSASKPQVFCSSLLWVTCTLSPLHMARRVDLHTQDSGTPGHNSAEAAALINAAQTIFGLGGA